MEIKFEKLLRPLEDDEYKRLEQSCLADGIRDPLVMWDDVLLDGHNRYKIANEHDLLFTKKQIELEDEAQARMWIINNQLGRRNLTPAELSYFRGLRYQEEKLSYKEAGDKKTPAEGRTREILAKEFGVSDRTIERDADFAEAVDAGAEKFGNDFKRKALRGDMSKKEVIAAVTPNPIIPESTGNEWWTPEEFITSVHNVLGNIDLDPASCDEANKTIQADTIYTKEINGLEKPWYGKIFMNPPYSMNKPFAQKMGECWDHNEVDEAIILLGAHAIETKWFSWYWDHTLCFTGHRIKFDTPNGKSIAGNIAGSVFIYLGNDPLRFAKEFEQHGYVVRRWPDA